MSDPNVIRTMRFQAWERAKGELNSMLLTYWEDDGFASLKHKIDDFTKSVEEEEL